MSASSSSPSEPATPPSQRRALLHIEADEADNDEEAALEPRSAAGASAAAASSARSRPGGGALLRGEASRRRWSAGAAAALVLVVGAVGVLVHFGRSGPHSAQQLGTGGGALQLEGAGSQEDDKARLRATLGALSAAGGLASSNESGAARHVGVEAQTRLELGAAAVAAHLFGDGFGDSDGTDANASAPAPLPAEGDEGGGGAAAAGDDEADDDADEVMDEAALREKLAELSKSKGEGDGQSRLEEGAGAFASHLFGDFDDDSDESDDDDEDDSGESLEAPTPSPDSLLGILKRIPATGSGWYRVNIKTIVRAGEAMNSTKIAVAPAGLFVHIVEQRGRRVRVDQAASSLEDARPVSGWMSLATADGHLLILRPSRQAEALNSQHFDENSTMADRMFANANSMAERRQYEMEAERMAKVTAMQKNLDDKLHSVNVGGLAKDLTHFGRHREEYAKKGVVETEKAGEHLVKSVESGADKLLGAILGDDKGSGSGEEGHGQHVGEATLPAETQQFSKAVFKGLKQAFA